MEKKLLNKLLLISAFIYIAVSSVFIAREMYWIFLFPIVLLIVYLAFFKVDYLLFFIVFSTPLAINLENVGGGFGLSLPTEPLLFGILLLFIFRLTYAGYPKKLAKHPVSIAIIFYLAWMFITMLTSSEPMVSFKFFVAKLWFIGPMFFVGVYLFEKKENAKRFIWLYFISLCIVVIYTLSRHIAHGMSEVSSHWVMEPFYKDHTSYGAILALFIPIMIGISIFKYKTKLINYISYVLIGLSLVGIVFSYTRAAWLSLFLILIMYCIILFKIKFKTLVFIGLVGVAFLVYKQDDIVQHMKKNKQYSSTNMAEHVQSMSNVSNDASNLERLNRWSCAIRMFYDRPVFGWGPGTYQFKYGRYQRKSEKTIISTNFGDKGGAHSEYLGPLCEYGFIGLLSVLFVFGAIIYTGLRVYKNAHDREIRILSIVVVLGLVTYMIHGFLNEFLDTDKASVPFWGLVAMLVAFDLHFVRKPEIEEIKKEG